MIRNPVATTIYLTEEDRNFGQELFQRIRSTGKQPGNLSEACRWFLRALKGPRGQEILDAVRAANSTNPG